MKIGQRILLYPILGLFYLVLLSDIVPENLHEVSKCFKISNMSDYPDYSFIAYLSGPTVEKGYRAFVISKDTCISQGFGIKTIRLFAIKKDLLKKYGSLSKIAFDQLEKMIKPVTMEDTYSVYVSDEDDTQRIELIYKIASITQNSLVLYKYDQVEYHSKSKKPVHHYYKKPKL